MFLLKKGNVSNKGNLPKGKERGRAEGIVVYSSETSVTRLRGGRLVGISGNDQHAYKRAKPSSRKT